MVKKTMILTVEFGYYFPEDSFIVAPNQFGDGLALLQGQGRWQCEDTNDRGTEECFWTR
jgi:hypothetical protein